MTSREWDDLPDEALVREALAGPTARARRAESHLFRRYRDRLYAWCFRQTRDRERALDLAQNTMLAAHRGLAKFRGQAKFSSWLFAIAYYQHLGDVRRRGLLIDGGADLDQVEGSAPDPAIQFERDHDDGRLLTLIHDALEPVEQMALWLRCAECKAVHEITRLLALENETGARALLQRARRKLRIALGPEGSA